MRKTQAPKDAGCPMWMVSFGDCVSLLVTFFVMLIAFSDPDRAQLMNVLNVLKGALGVRHIPESQGGDAPVAVLKHIAEQSGFVNQQRESLSKQRFTRTLFDKRFSRLVVGNTDKSVMLMMLRNGLSLRISAAALFNDGATEVIPGKEWLLDAIADVIVSLNNEIRIVHVLPLQTPVPGGSQQTVWNLAMERSWNVREYFLKIGAMTEERCSLGVKILPPGGAQNENDMPGDHLEVLFVGYHPSRADLPESLLMN